jgi:hypothetical protein
MNEVNYKQSLKFYHELLSGEAVIPVVGPGQQEEGIVLISSGNPMLFYNAMAKCVFSLSR